MKNFKLTLIIILMSLPLMSCIDEPAEPQSVNEIISEISRTWTCSENENGFPREFEATVSADPVNSSRIIISNFHDIGTNLSVYAVVYKDLTVEIPEQTVNNMVFKGTGDISNDYTEINWNYTIEDENGDITNVTGKYTYGIGA